MRGGAYFGGCLCTRVLTTVTVLTILCGQALVSAQETTAPPVITTAPPVVTTTPKQNCSSRGTECSTCVEDVSCYFCQSVSECRTYPGSRILPNKECPLADTRWAICWLNFEALIISISVIGALILITISCTIYCCCCRSGGSSKRWAREDKKADRQREDIRLKHEERRADRKSKNDEIRRKYGLVKDDNPYMKFENDKP